MRLTVIGDGPPVLKIAGLAGGVGLYREECAAAAAAGFRVALVDTSGDRHDDPAPAAITWDFLAAEIDSALDALGAPRAVLWGTSYGCLVALAAAARQPRRVTGLLLGHPPEPSAQPSFFPELLRWAESRRDPDRSTRLVTVLAFVAFAGWEALLFPSVIRRAPTLVRASLEARTPSRTVRDKLHIFWNDGPGVPPRDLWPRTSIIAGRWDRIGPFEGARRLSETLSGSRLLVMERSGHGGAFTHPAEYHRRVTSELRRLFDRGALPARP